MLFTLYSKIFSLKGKGLDKILRHIRLSCNDCFPNDYVSLGFGYDSEGLQVHYIDISYLSIIQQNLYALRIPHDIKIGEDKDAPIEYFVPWNPPENVEAGIREGYVNCDRIYNYMKSYSCHPIKGAWRAYPPAI